MSEYVLPRDGARLGVRPPSGRSPTRGRDDPCKDGAEVKTKVSPSLPDQEYAQTHVYGHACAVTGP